eukprot:403344467
MSNRNNQPSNQKPVQKSIQNLSVQQEISKKRLHSERDSSNSNNQGNIGQAQQQAKRMKLNHETQGRDSNTASFINLANNNSQNAARVSLLSTNPSNAINRVSNSSSNASSSTHLPQGRDPRQQTTQMSTTNNRNPSQVQRQNTSSSQIRPQSPLPAQNKSGLGFILDNDRQPHQNAILQRIAQTESRHQKQQQLQQQQNTSSSIDEAEMIDHIDLTDDGDLSGEGSRQSKESDKDPRKRNSNLSNSANTNSNRNSSQNAQQRESKSFSYSTPVKKGQQSSKDQRLKQSVEFQSNMGTLESQRLNQNSTIVYSINESDQKVYKNLVQQIDSCTVSSQNYLDKSKILENSNQKSHISINSFENSPQILRQNIDLTHQQKSLDPRQHPRDQLSTKLSSQNQQIIQYASPKTVQRRQSQASIHKDSSRLINTNLIKTIVTDVAQRSGLNNITKSCLRELQFYMIEYMRLAIEEIVDLGRADRNTAYLVNKHSVPGQMSSMYVLSQNFFDEKMMFGQTQDPPTLDLICTSNEMQRYFVINQPREIQEDRNSYNAQKQNINSALNFSILNKLNLSSIDYTGKTLTTQGKRGKRQKKNDQSKDEGSTTQDQRDSDMLNKSSASDFNIDSMYQQQNKDTINQFVSMTNQSGKKVKNMQKGKIAAKISDQHDSSATKTSQQDSQSQSNQPQNANIKPSLPTSDLLIFNSKNLHDQDHFAMSCMPQRRIGMRVFRAWLDRTKLVQPAKRLKILEEMLILGDELQLQTNNAEVKQQY